MFGTLHPWTTELNFPQRTTHLGDARNNIVLMKDPVQSEGDVFAFMARIYKRELFYFQIWRPVVGTNKFTLIASRPVIPSVAEQQEQHEDVR